MISLLSVLAAAQVQAAQPVTAFVHAEVVRSDRPAIAHDQTVIVRGDLIAWVGPSSKARLEPAARRTDARGKYLLAGFADMHVHIGREGDLLTYVANGVTTVRNMWGESQHLAWRESIKSGTLLGPRIVTSGAILDGDPPSVPQMTVLTDAGLARAEIEQQAAAGYDFIKVYNSLPAAVYDSIVLVARERSLPVAGHVPFAVGLRGAMAGGQRSIEHLRGYVAELVPADAPVQPGASLKSRSVAWNYIDTTRIERLAEETVRSGIWNCPTLMVTQELLAPPERWDSLARRPVFRYLGPDARADRSAIPYLKDFTPDDYREALRGLAGQRRLVSALAQAGTKLLAGTDSYLQGFAFQAELEELHAAGLRPWDVLMIATVNPARYFGDARASGTVTASATADLQLIDGNPLVSLAALHRRLGVMVRGRWYPKQELDRQLEALATADRAGQPQHLPGGQHAAP